MAKRVVAKEAGSRGTSKASRSRSAPRTPSRSSGSPPPASGRQSRSTRRSATDPTQLGSSPFFGGGHIERHRLANGLTVLLLVDASAPTASYHTWFKVGSRHERAGKTGLAHLFEHLMFNETKNLPAGVFDATLEENGAETNAATWVDWTYYYESLPSDRIGLAIELEAERMANLVLREPQVTSEIEVVANERRMRVDDDVEGAASELLYKTAFITHTYHAPTIGWMTDIQGFTPSDCEEFYKTYYAPNNATVVVVGDIDPKAVLKKIVKEYGAIAASEVPAEDIHPEPPQLEPRLEVVAKPTSTEKLLIGFHGPALGDADHAPATVLSEILFGGRASRLHRLLVLEKENALDVRGWVSTFRDPGLWEMYATAREGVRAKDLEALVLAEVERVRSELVSVAELERAKARLELALVQSLETAAGKAEQIGFYETVLGNPSYSLFRLEETRRVDLADVRRVARRYLAPGSRTVIRVIPDASGKDSEATE